MFFRLQSSIGVGERTLSQFPLSKETGLWACQGTFRERVAGCQRLSAIQDCAIQRGEGETLCFVVLPSPGSPLL